MKPIFIISLAVLILNTGCSFYIGSKITDPPKPKTDIRLVSNDTYVEHCEKIGPVTADSSWGGIAMQGVGRKEVRKKLLNQTDQLGGNVLRLNNISSGMGGATGEGVAFKCQLEWLDKIPARETIDE